MKVNYELRFSCNNKTLQHNLEWIINILNKHVHDVFIDMMDFFIVLNKAIYHDDDVWYTGRW